MTTKTVVSDEQYGKFSKRRDEVSSRVSKGVINFDLAMNVMQAFISGDTISITKVKKIDWLAKILDRERQAHLAFFDQEFNLTKFEKTLRQYGRKKVKAWQKLGMEPIFPPKVSMMLGDDYPGWREKPEKWFYEKLMEGKLFRDINGELKKILNAEFEGVTLLVDTRLKPAYDNGRQMWGNDNLLSQIIEELHRSERIAKYEHGPQSSRFGVSVKEWESEIKPVLAAKLGLSVEQVRLETTIERNVIPQIYSHMPRKDDGKTNTSVWTEEFFGGRGYRLDGGDADDGGLASVRYDDADDRWSSRSFRPLAEL